MRDPLSIFGIEIKKKRKEQEITLQALAERTGLTAGLLSKIENFRTIPSLPVLMTIIAALKIDPAELFRGLNQVAKSKYLLIRSADRKPVEREESRKFHYELILEAPLPVGGNMQLMFVRMPAGSGGAPVTTDADELLYILEGEFNYLVDGERVRLAAGDTLFFDGRLPHGPEKPGEAGSLLAFYFFQQVS